MPLIYKRSTNRSYILTSCLISFFKYWTFWNHPIWLVDSNSSDTQSLDFYQIYYNNGTSWKTYQKAIKGSQEEYWTDRRKEWEMNREKQFHTILCLLRVIYRRHLTISCRLDIFLIILWCFGYFQPYQTNFNHLLPLCVILDILFFQELCYLISQERLGQ